VELILVVTSYPSNNAEPYLEAELRQLSKVFDTLHLIQTQFKPTEVKYELPSNVIVHRFEAQKAPLTFLPFLNARVRKTFFEEINSIRTQLKLPFSWLKYKIIHQGLFKAIRFEEFLNEISAKYSIKAQLIYTYWTTEYTLGACFFAQKNKLKVITRCHGWDCFYDRNPQNYLPFRSSILKMIDYVFPVSKAGVKHLQVKFNSPKIQVRYLASEPLQVKETTKSTSFHLLSLAFTSPIKRIELIAQALSLIEFDVKWTHIGFNSNEYSDQLKRTISDLLSSKGNISFVPLNAMNQKDVAAWMSSNFVDLFVSVSKAEGLPVSMMQAQSAGIPILSTNVGGVSELVQHNENGFLLGPNPTAEELAAQIVRFFELDELEKEKLRTQALKNFQTHFHAHLNYVQFANELLSLSNQ
jgi:glycosyltransferase involved in cell wall biosynthesis